MITVARAGPGSTQEPLTPSWSFMWEAGAQALGASSVSLSGTLAVNRSAARTQAGALTWDAAVSRADESMSQPGPCCTYSSV